MSAYFVFFDMRSARLYERVEGTTRRIPFILNGNELMEINCSCKFDFMKETPVITPTVKAYEPGILPVFADEHILCGHEYDFEYIYQQLMETIITGLEGKEGSLYILFNFPRELTFLHDAFNDLTRLTRPILEKKIQGRKLRLKGLLDETYCILGALELLADKDDRNYLYLTEGRIIAAFGEQNSLRKAVLEIGTSEDLIETLLNANEIHSMHRGIVKEIISDIVYSGTVHTDNVQMKNRDYKFAISLSKGRHFLEGAKNDFVRIIKDHQLQNDIYTLFDITNSWFANEFENIFTMDELSFIRRDPHQFLNYFCNYAEIVEAVNHSAQGVRIRRKLRKTGRTDRLPHGAIFYELRSFIDRNHLESLLDYPE